MIAKTKTIREARKGSTEVSYLSVPVKFTWPSLSVSAVIAVLYSSVPWITPPQLPFEVAYRYIVSPELRVLPAEVDVISLPLLTLAQVPSMLKSRLDPTLFQTRYSVRPTYTVVEHEPVPPAVLTVSPKAVREESVAVLHEPPIEFAKVVHVPLEGE